MSQKKASGKRVLSPRRIGEGEYAWREDLYDRVGEQLGENTRSGAIGGACEFTAKMIPALEAVAEHPDMTEDLAHVSRRQP